MSSLGGDEGSRVLSKDMDIWVGALNDSDSPAGLEDELFAVPHDAEGTRALLQALVPGRPLPAEVDVRCSSGDEQRFRDGCFLLVKMAHDWPLRLLVKPLAADAGDVELGEGVLLVGVGVGTDEPFGPAGANAILDVDKVRAMSGGLTTWVGTVNANHALAADLAADPELEPHLTTPATSAAAKVAIHALARGLQLPLEIVRRCDDPADQGFRDGAVDIVKRVLGEGLRLQVVPVGAGQGRLSEAGHKLIVHIGSDPEHPFGH